MKIFISFLLLLFATFSQGQDIASISIDRPKSYLQGLSSDSLKGRGNYQQVMYDAATFIDSHFRINGLIPFPGSRSLIQSFFYDGTSVFKI